MTLIVMYEPTGERPALERLMLSRNRKAKGK